MLLDLALDEDLHTVFRYVNKSRAWEEAVAHGQSHPAMIIGVSDGGAHLDRDDGSDWSTAFLAFWVRDRKLWSLEEGIRQLTQVPAALLGFEGRGMLLPGYWADAFIFDPDTIELESKKQVNDFPGGEARYSARPRGICMDDRERRADRARRRGAHREPARAGGPPRGGLTPFQAWLAPRPVTTAPRPRGAPTTGVRRSGLMCSDDCAGRDTSWHGGPVVHPSDQSMFGVGARPRPSRRLLVHVGHGEIGARGDTDQFPGRGLQRGGHSHLTGVLSEPGRRRSSDRRRWGRRSRSSLRRPGRSRPSRAHARNGDWPAGPPRPSGRCPRSARR